MCLIIQTNDKSETLTRDEVADIFGKNRDGFGVMWQNEANELQTTRCLPKTSNEAWEAIQPYLATPCVFHWRQATHGVVSLENTHPFDCGAGISVVHNGILQGYGDPRTKSDTRDFIERVITPALTSIDVLYSDEFKAAIEPRIRGSAMVFLSERGPLRLGNTGLEHKGRWYSNTYAWSAPVTSYPNQGWLGRYDAEPSWRVEYESSTSWDVWFDAKLIGTVLTDPAVPGEPTAWAYLADCIDLMPQSPKTKWLTGRLRDEKFRLTDAAHHAWIVELAIELLSDVCEVGVELQVSASGRLVIGKSRSSKKAADRDVSSRLSEIRGRR